MRHFISKKMVITIWIMSLGSGSAIADNTLDPERLAKVEALVVRPAEDTSPPMPKNEEERIATEKMIQKRADDERERLNEIRTQPGMKPYLFQLLDTLYFHSPHIGVYSSMGDVPVLKAIASRDDLEASDVNVIANELKRIQDTPFSLADTSENGFAYFGIPILEAHPSPENEMILIGLIARTDHIDWTHVKVRAAKVLAIIGSDKSVPHLADAETWSESIGGADLRWKAEVIDPIFRASEHLKRRLKKEHSLAIGRIARSRDLPVGGFGNRQGKLFDWMTYRVFWRMAFAGLVIFGALFLWRKKHAR